MDGSRTNACLAEMTPEEIRLWPRFLATWERAGSVDEEEAVEWRRRIPSFVAFLDLDAPASAPN